MTREMNYWQAYQCSFYGGIAPSLLTCITLNYIVYSGVLYTLAICYCILHLATSPLN